MEKEIRLIITEGEADMLGNDGNAQTSIAFVGGNSFVTMLFGGRDGSARDSITIDEIRDIAQRIGEDVDEQGDDYATQLAKKEAEAKALGEALKAAQTAFLNVKEMHERAISDRNDLIERIIKASK